MALNKLFDTIQSTKEMANWQAAFGEPQEVEGQTIIPVAQVGHGFGLGFGQGSGPAEAGDEPESAAEGGGAGGAAWSKPLGVMVVTDEKVYFEETVDASRVAVVGLLVAALAIFQVAKTLQMIFGRK